MFGLMAVPALVLVALLVLSAMSRRVPPLGLDNGVLRDCPGSPNCVCSEAASAAARVPPLPFTGDPQQAWARLRDAVQATGGSIVADHDGYLHARYQTPLLRFVDDLEARLNRTAGCIELRSASRVGHSDLGANRKRVQTLRAAYGKLIPGKE